MKVETRLETVKGSASGKMFRMIGTAGGWRGAEIYIGAESAEALESLARHLWGKDLDRELAVDVVIADAKKFKPAKK